MCCNQLNHSVRIAMVPILVHDEIHCFVSKFALVPSDAIIFIYAAQFFFEFKFNDFNFQQKAKYHLLYPRINLDGEN